MTKPKAKEKIDKVLAARIKKPFATVREIAKDLGMSKSAVSRADQKAGPVGTKDDRIVNLTDEDMRLQRLIQKRKLKLMTETPEQVSNSDVNAWDKHSMARYTLFRGNATDKDGGLKNAAESMTTEDLLKIAGAE